MSVEIPVSTFHHLVIENNKCYLYSSLTKSLIRELDRYETPMVLAAYRTGKEENK